mgnify:CR=1 FL=1
MKKRIILTFSVVIVAVLTYVLIKSQNNKIELKQKYDVKYNDNNPTLKNTQTLRDNRKAHLVEKQKPITSKRINNGNLKTVVKNHLILMHQMGENAQEKYLASVNLMKKNKDEVSNILFDQYKKLPEESYASRQKVIETLRVLQSNVSIPMLVEISLSPIPDEKSKDLHHESTRQEEGIIRLTAIEGLGYFAKKGSSLAKDTLNQILRDDKTALPLKRQAVRETLLSIPPNEIELKKQELREILDPNIHFIITQKVDSPDEQMPDLEVVPHDHAHEGHDHHHSQPPKIETH